jgi:hypothetical protein
MPGLPSLARDQTNPSQSVASLTSFVLAMSLYPDQQVHSRAEIDTVVGRDRLPTLADRPRLPRVQALLMEVIRWHLVTPQGESSKAASAPLTTMALRFTTHGGRRCDLARVLDSQGLNDHR